MNRFHLWLIIMMVSLASAAQDRPVNDSIGHVKTLPSYWLFKGGYQNETPFMGRKDSVANPYASGKVAYFHHSGFFVSGSMSYATSSEASRLDVISFTGGYSHLFSNWNTAIYLSQNFYSEESYNIRAEIGTSLGGFVGYSSRIVDLYVDGGIYWNKENADFILGIETSHDFYLGSGDVRISPMAYINLGTQQYFDQYVRSNRSANAGSGKGKGMMNPAMPDQASTTYVASSDKFQLLDLELSLSMHYYLDRWQLSFVPEYIIPFNPATIIVDGETREEQIDNVFLWSLAVKYRLYGKRK